MEKPSPLGDQPRIEGFHQRKREVENEKESLHAYILTESCYENKRGVIKKVLHFKKFTKGRERPGPVDRAFGYYMSKGSMLSTGWPTSVR